MLGSGRKALLEIRQWSEGPTGYPGVVVRPAQISGSGWVTLLNVREWSGGPPKYPGRPPGSPRVVGNPSRMSGSAR